MWMLEDSDWDLRLEALTTRGQLEPAALALYADAVVARLSDSSEYVRMGALEMLHKLEPATLAQHADAIVARLEDSDRDAAELA